MCKWFAGTNGRPGVTHDTVPSYRRVVSREVYYFVERWRRSVLAFDHRPGEHR